jgi:divalent metal cation (Fe/Co/Zn/Cd) transporter
VGTLFAYVIAVCSPVVVPFLMMKWWPLKRGHLAHREKRRRPDTSRREEQRMNPRVTTSEACLSHAAPKPQAITAVFWLQGITLAWMVLECAVSLYAASAAHSSALLAFGADSLIELLSATVALLAFLAWFPITKDRASQWSGLLLYVLAAVVAGLAIASVVYDLQPNVSHIGIGITVAALIVMPILSWQKRKMARTTGNRSLAADATQSATCAYLAGVTLLGLSLNLVFHIHWIDSAAALAAVPILIIEGRKASRGEGCGCTE